MNGMNRIYAAGLGIAACIAMASFTEHDARAQAPITRQMQDTQRAAQTKARETQTPSHKKSKKQGASSPMAASAAQ
jgi:hypothetical protein